ncbi:uncharacterized protein LOC120114064 [Hibiscus syriacus]|uniref:uncharacterized protein LOC120114064 n=1 Tax=Hibiscus syriacus TaxID=106335 RepID=UPI001920FC71|nr:uncharacterized protein LOC120114064 [Hibiscus syriacus]
MLVVDPGLDMDDCNSLPLSPHHFIVAVKNRIICTIRGRAYVVVIARNLYNRLYHNTKPSDFDRSCTVVAEVHNTKPSDFDRSCTVVAEVPIKGHNISALPTLDIYNKLSEGFLLGCMASISPGAMNPDYRSRTLHPPFSRGIVIFLECLFFYFYDPDNDSDCRFSVEVTAGFITLRTLPGILAGACNLQMERRHLSMDDKIEEFPSKTNNLVPIRYYFKEIRKMTWF